MENKNMGVLNKRAQKDKTDKNIVALLVIIAILVIGVFVITNSIEKNKEEAQTANIETIIKEGQTKIIFVTNSDTKKCKDCTKIKNKLDSKKISYLTYDVSKYSKKEYKETLQKLSINPSDFGYPAVIYVREGKLYSNVINLSDTKVVDDFIKDYDLAKVK